MVHQLLGGESQVDTGMEGKRRQVAGRIVSQEMGQGILVAVLQMTTHGRHGAWEDRSSVEAGDWGHCRSEDGSGEAGSWENEGAVTKAIRSSSDSLNDLLC